jgi:hypothetical protein
MVHSFFLFVILSWICQTYSEPQNNIELGSRFDCPTWHFYNKGNGKCECYKSIGETDVIKSKENGITLLQYGQCMTHDGNTTVVAKCPYFQPTGYNTSEVGYITLPSNVSELT